MNNSTLRFFALLLFMIDIISCDDNPHSPSWRGYHYGYVPIYGVILDSLTNSPLSGVMIGAAVGTLNKTRFDSIAKHQLEQKLIEDSCRYVSYSDSIGQYKLITYKVIVDGQQYVYDSSYYKRYLVAYKPGYKIWYFNSICDTLRTAFESDGSPREIRISAIRLSKL